jgi:hypothetical protein
VWSALQAMEAVLHTDIPRLMAMLPDEAAYAYSNPSGLDPGSAEAMQALPQLGVGDGWVVCNHEKAESGRWQEDTAQPYCPLCANDFGLTLRRHHCRKCGVGTASLLQPHTARRTANVAVSCDCALLCRDRAPLYVCCCRASSATTAPRSANRARATHGYATAASRPTT